MNLAQQSAVAPSCLGHDVMERLMHLPHVARSQTRRHRLDALALNGKKKALGVVLHGNDTIGMSGDLRQPAQVRGQTLRLACGPLPASSHRAQVTASRSRVLSKSQRRNHTYNTVVLRESP